MLEHKVEISKIKIKRKFVDYSNCFCYIDNNKIKELQKTLNFQYKELAT